MFMSVNSLVSDISAIDITRHGNTFDFGHYAEMRRKDKDWKLLQKKRKDTIEPKPRFRDKDPTP